ncbi:MAG TPA: DNA-binding transcriptional regulator Fis [Steroidobacteraceae bacterium]|nr:DNA-binding transcriptional regulator Fis [Steroidobacteraceae bacterium]
MVAKKNGRTRREFATRSGARELPLRTHTERALNDYFASLNGHRPAHLYDLVLREVEEPLLKAVLDYTEGNQVRAADILGINRGTLRKKLRLHGIAG